MQAPEIFQIYRQRFGYTQNQLAEQLHISPQAISRWETGETLPSIDNLVALSDLYDLSLDQLILAGPYFKRPLIIDRPFAWPKFIGFAIIWTLISLFLTGFGYQPWWLFALVLIVGLIFVLPVVFQDYWQIDRTGLRVTHYQGGSWQRIAALWRRTPQQLLSYAEMTQVKLSYQLRQQQSPWDFWPDPVIMQVTLEDGQQVSLNLSGSLQDYLPRLVMFLSRQHIQVIDEQHLVDKLLMGQDLYQSFH
ncbi:helix-turn-helix domain-containing protein [Lapidilactobacillus wuchangensis]|uniref:helix-turn-helix domain-containing protein n=1 Tax=Lapidilactobacillus wuchangensis TaxID=2486001 RepID=UPI0013DE27C1|nr:helix-turn-helix transcriptional regulator [Lapidilactobacillus wuchangensis]